MRAINFWLPLLSYGILFIPSDGRDAPHIAIVGGGIGGTTSAFFLREEFGAAATIDLYEPNVIGGKVCSTTVGDREYESGAVFLTSTYFYILRFIDILGLKTQEIKHYKYLLSTYNSNGNVFAGSKWKPVQVARLLWKYGWELPSLYYYCHSRVGHFFPRTYDLQDQRQSFSTLGEMLEAISGELGSLMQQSTYDHLVEQGYSQAILSELVGPYVKLTYGQATEVNALLGLLMISELPRVLFTSAIVGGNKQLPELLLSRSQVHLIREKVTAISYSVNNITNSQPVYQLHSKAGSGSEHISKDYDIVIIATPMNGNAANITFRQFKTIFPFSATRAFYPYVQTLIRGMPNVTRFGAEMFDESTYPLMIPVDIDVIYAIARVEPIPGTKEAALHNKEYVWSVFSSLPLSQEILDKLFISWHETKQSNWTNYAPPLAPLKDPMPPFELQEQLYYLNTIEHMGTAQELIAIAAKNMVIRAFERWYGRPDIKDNLKNSVHQDL